MAIKHNQQIQHNHFRKDWQTRVRCHFDQPGRKLRRRNARIAKAAAVAPRPVDKLHPVVRCPTIKYNRRVRAGRGFTLAELKEAGIPKKFALTIGITVDARRQNLSEESLKANVARLKEYKARLILFPRKSGSYKKGDSSKEDVKAALAGEGIVRGDIAPIRDVDIAGAISEIKKSDMPAGEENAFKRLRAARSDARLVGVRAKRAEEKAEAEASKKK
ncbi:MAG: 60S ribosomal protein L13 [Cirrosporium novae-zelandiae]|nr:MAG: 60S ribosomal protein L13 [Cirrosporium novae-zelandiae]